MIELQDLSKTYVGSARPAVHALNLCIASGEFVALIGDSGSGKTSTLNMINRLIEPSGGKILIDGVDARAGDPVILRRQMGYVLQGAGLFPHLTVGENVGITPRLLGHPKAEIAARVDELLTLVRMEPGEYRDRFPAALSGGQAQRVALARALAAKPYIMLMDEPFGALDPLIRDDLADDYRRIHNELHLTTVFVTHDMTEAMMLADRIAVMRDGALVQFGTPNELLNEPADDLVKQLIETPRTRARRLAQVLRASA